MILDMPVASYRALDGMQSTVHWSLCGAFSVRRSDALGRMLLKARKWVLSGDRMSPMDLHPSLWYLSITAALFISLHRWWNFRSRSNGLPLPPGPRSLPIIGNALDIPTTAMAAKFRDLSAVYGLHYSTPPTCHIHTYQILDLRRRYHASKCFRKAHDRPRLARGRHRPTRESFRKLLE